MRDLQGGTEWWLRESNRSPHQLLSNMFHLNFRKISKNLALYIARISLSTNPSLSNLSRFESTMFVKSRFVTNVLFHIFALCHLVTVFCLSTTLQVYSTLNKLWWYTVWYKEPYIYNHHTKPCLKKKQNQYAHWTVCEQHESLHRMWTQFKKRKKKITDQVDYAKFDYYYYYF